MWVKKFHATLKSMNVDPQKDIKGFLEGALAYLKVDDELEDTRFEFDKLFRKKILEAMFDYFPEMKEYAEEIDKRYNEIIDKHIDVIFEDALAVIYQFIDNPNKSDEGYRSHKYWRSDEELEAEADKYAKKAPEEIRDKFREGFLLSLKNMRHYKHFGDIVHEQILACITEFFEDIPELSGDGIRYFDSVMWDKSVWLFDDLKGILAGRTIEPYDEEAPYKE